MYDSSISIWKETENPLKFKYYRPIYSRIILSASQELQKNNLFLNYTSFNQEQIRLYLVSQLTLPGMWSEERN